MFGETQPPRGAARLRRRTQMPVFRRINLGDQRHSGRWSLQWFASVCKTDLTRRRSDQAAARHSKRQRPLAARQTRWRVAGRWKAVLRTSALKGDFEALGACGAKACPDCHTRRPDRGSCGLLQLSEPERRFASPRTRLYSNADVGRREHAGAADRTRPEVPGGV